MEYKSSKDHCEEYSGYEYCKIDPECVWCMEPAEATQVRGCMHRNKKSVSVFLVEVNTLATNFGIA